MTAPRQVLPGVTYLITRRCFDRMFLLRPSPQVNGVVEYVLAAKAKEAGPVDDLKAKAAADPKDFQSRLDLAMAYWAGGQKQEAIDELLAMIKADRAWNEGAARAQLLKFFEALGFADPLAVDGRKRLSTILFS